MEKLIRYVVHGGGGFDCILFNIHFMYHQASCLCELGIYGVFLCDSRAPSDQSIEIDASTANKVDQSSVPLSDVISFPYINKYAGYLLRVKPADSDEGGVAAGYAVLSSPDLIGE